MTSGTWLVSFAGWASLCGGILVTITGIVLFGALFFSRGVPVGGAGAFALLSLGAGPILAGLGATATFAAVKLWSGQPWARTYLEVFFWFVALAVVGYIGYEGARIKEMASGNVIRGAIYFFFLGLPPMILAIVLRSLPR